MTMKRLLGPCLLGPCLLAPCLVVLCLTLAACGDSTSDTASDPGDQTSTPAGETSAPDVPSPTPGQEPQPVAIVSQTAAGGAVDLNAVPVEDGAARREFTAQFKKGGLDEKIAQAVAAATVPEGFTVMGAVVSIGCDVPPGVTVSQSEDGWVFTPQKVPSPLQECFAPVTSVALVAVPA
jgi:hypothetical protein